MIPGTDAEERWQFITTGLSRLAGRGLSLDGDAYAAALTSRARGLSIALLLQSRHLIDSDPDETVDLYMRQGAISVSARDLATMAATLASGGINPMTKQAAVDPQSCRHTLAVMATAGFHETSGDWLYDTGLPAASGAAGAIVAASPGKGGASILAPPADCTGCSVRGRLVATFLADRLGLNLFLSKPDP
jgi:glutaminase